jgi:carbonic anhydrase
MKDNVIEQIVYLRRNQLLKGVEVRGVIYSVESGKVEFIE